VVVPCGQTDIQSDMTKLIVPFRNSANAPVHGALKSGDAYSLQLADRGTSQLHTIVCHTGSQPVVARNAD